MHGLERRLCEYGYRWRGSEADSTHLQSLETTTTPSHNSKLKEKLSIYHVTIPAEIANSIGFQETTPMLRRNYGCICLSPMGKTEPRPTPEDSDEGEKMDENTFTAAVDSKLNEIADNDFDALYI